MKNNTFRYVDGYTYKLDNENWRTPIFVDDGRHNHLVEVEEITPYGSYMQFGGESYERCAFCQAHLNFNRSLEEILFHFNKTGRAEHDTLITKWKNEIDAWDNPFGYDIKG